ncbi:MAG: FAD-dependent oxidoreductase [Ilumatobacteraceae bacterium]|jgi:2,4-dienoyl-CoA reductase-like NADH-dependent reductase (Old Yellow Enzyme family)/thioredoxin reductase|nr:FAD-dependent oxidoreductase [Ilumatobacteraceae bacterium]
MSHRYEHLFTPLQVGPLTLKNRIVRSAHGTLMTGERLIAYHEARAAGGVALSTLEATGVHADAPSLIPLHSDECIPFYREISSRMRPYGMALLQQIYHPGSATRPKKAATQVSASAIPNPMVGGIPTAMSTAQIHEMVEAFGAAARRCREGGLDGIDLHASSGYLIEQFLSPANNVRDDEYGGSLENRMRFLMEILDCIRAEVGRDYLVGIRLPNEEYIPGGLTPDDVAEIARIVEPHVDYVSLHMGSYWRFYKLLAPMDEPLANEMPSNAVITAGLTAPTMVVGRIMTLDDAERIVADGAADMVSMVRALIADPELVAKSERGEAHLVRPCIGSNVGCVGQLMSTGTLSCVVNVAAARETAVPFDPPGPAPERKRVLVVGGGPAGLEAARTAALRGHEVHLYEANRHLGGQVAIAATAPHRSDIGAITEWLTDEVERLGVTIRLATMVTPDVVAELAPDEVILATGVSPRRDGFQLTTPVEPVPGHDLAHVFTSWDVFGFGGRAELVGPALVYDDTGTFEAISVADRLLEAGLAVTMVGRLDAIGATLPYPPATVAAAKERLMSGAFDFVGGHHLLEIHPDAVDIGVAFTDRRRTIPASTVVIVTYGHPNRELGELLDAEPGAWAVHRIGDVTGTNGLLPAIHQAAALARAI